jgi:site-specific DNA-methyltransferase (adenine-specific)
MGPNGSKRPNVGPTNKGGRGHKAAGFMGKQWDGGDIAFRPELWAEVLRVLKPGAHFVAFSGSRTYHRMACAIEDAGFEIRDQIMWLYGSGFPKSHDVGKGFDKAAGAEREVVGVDQHAAKRPAGRANTYKGADEYRLGSDANITAPATDLARQWDGWGTALKPAHEPIVLARKPLIGTVAANVARHGTGAINVDGCRIAGEPVPVMATNGGCKMAFTDRPQEVHRVSMSTAGRWPANVCHDGSDEVLEAFAKFAAPGQQGRARTDGSEQGNGVYGALRHVTNMPEPRGDTGTAARFFYEAKASKAERGAGNTHPTVKPLALMRWLCRLVTPPGGTVLDPFLGSGSTAIAACQEGFSCIGIEQSAEYMTIARARIAADAPLFAEVA